MNNFTNPLGSVKIASPCAADWNEMVGDERKRFCFDCKLNVYNFSAMTKPEAENLLINSEGRLCVRFYRRADGTILTQNCPVGWAKVKQRVSKIATAAFSMIAGFFGGFAVFSQFTSIDQSLFRKVSVKEGNTLKNNRIVVNPNQLTKESLPIIPLATVGRIDPSAFTHIKKNRKR